MAGLGPFEAAPRLAVAVSGGADSLALTLLAQDWVERQGGSLLALTVDHGLRHDSAAEARRVGRILARFGISHRILTADQPAPATNLQAWARDLRYRLLLSELEREGIFHLLLGHHQEDQAETLLLRLGRGSGLAGLAAMAPKTPLPEAQLLRPLLTVPKARLSATLRQLGVDWIEDPSNRDPVHARVRMRRLMPSLAKEGLEPARLAATAEHLGRARAALEASAAALLAQSTRLDPQGFLELDPEALRRAEPEVALRALAQALATLGGQRHAPRWDRLTALFQRLCAPGFRGATLGGCRIHPWRGRLLLCREAAGTERVEVVSGSRLRWDGRFEVTLRRHAAGGPFVLQAFGAADVAAGGQGGWAALAKAWPPALKSRGLPPVVRPGLPALIDREGLRALPSLGYDREGRARGAVKDCVYLPCSPLTSCRFTVV